LSQSCESSQGILVAGILRAETKMVIGIDDHGVAILFVTCRPSENLVDLQVDFSAMVEHLLKTII
jgi:hypothetical protein